MGASENARSVAYGLLNVASASGIVFANKAVLSTFGFHFIYALTLVRTAQDLLTKPHTVSVDPHNHLSPPSWPMTTSAHRSSQSAPR